MGYVDKEGNNVLTAVCSHVMESLRQVGAVDATRCLVRLLASGQVTGRDLDQSISLLQHHWLSNGRVIDMEARGQVLTAEQEAVRLLLPVLRAQSLGKRRWCGHCWKLTPDRNLPMCMRCTCEVVNRPQRHT